MAHTQASPTRRLAAAVGVGLALVLMSAGGAWAVEDLHGYQGDSVDNLRSGSQGLWTEVRMFYRGLNMTPPKWMLVVGLLGALYTANKNKRLPKWGAVAALSYLLVLVGAAILYKESSGSN